ncbi:polysaccharide lyase family 8 super-sandwich domain-containing protein [uncultured Cyclobacterium sp.]|uniref:polysaccharide lyase family 8 super-sandwich domain-containing protein n=1 Tax=uncultured Cyclobacterium sp. TaxID=453820 RepID=UPI0030EDDC3A|tara:strand:- start:140721 stop:142904 length:2184 start_codon:yes stop_codon:yes gene_type:complete
MSINNLPKKTLLILFLSLGAFLSSTLLAQVNEIRLIRDRVVEELKTSQIDTGEITRLLKEIQSDGSFININYSDLSRTASFPHRKHTYGLVTLAKAYETKGSPFFQNQSLLDKIKLSTKFWVARDFIGENWHNNQITTPGNLVNLMLLIGDKLPSELVEQAQPIIGRANMNASGARPSGDRIVIAGILAKNLLFNENRDGFDEVIDIIANEIKFSNGERGMQQDYSFHHRKDRVNNTTSYGYGKYANAFGEWSDYVAGTSYAFEKDKINQLVDYYLDGVYKQLVYGIYEDISVKNRSIANRSTFYPKGTLEIERLLRSTDYRKKELEEIISLRKGESSPSLSFSKFFWQTEHFVVQRPNYYTTVRMFSSRNENMEEPYNGPGITTHHRADGTNYLMLKGDEYHDIWPVYDWQKISGTTILQKPELLGGDLIQKAGKMEFVGAVENGQNGAVGFDFISPHDGTKAKKAWFFFDQSYVCLGTGIQGSQELPIVTTVDQVLLRSPVSILQANKTPLNLSQGDHTIDHLKWLYHGNIGYIFPNEGRVHVSNKTATGRWSDITDQKNISNKVVSEEVLEIWFDHGVKPENGKYAYMVFPSISVSELKSIYKAGTPYKVLSNTEELQAVMNKNENELQAVFYQSGNLLIENDLNLQMENAGIIMLNVKKGKVQSFSISDPTRKLTALKFTLDGLYSTKEAGIQVIKDKKTKTSQFIVQMPKGAFAGKSINFEL